MQDDKNPKNTDEGETREWHRASIDLTNYEEHVFKFLLIGDSAVGKTTFLNQYMDGSGSTATFIPTVGVDFRVKRQIFKISKDGDEEMIYHKLCIQLWDTAGMERFRSMTTSFFRDANGFLLLIDLTNENSFVNAFDWLLRMEENSPNDGYDVVLVGNKSDLKELRKLDHETVLSFTERNSLPYIESSAKTGENVTEAVQMLLDLAISRQQEKAKRGVTDTDLTEQPYYTIEINNKPTETKGNCNC